MKSCDCNQGRRPCTCGGHGTSERPLSATLAVSTLLIVALYLAAHWMIR